MKTAEELIQEMDERSAQIAKEVEASSERIAKEVDARSERIAKEIEASSERINREMDQTIARTNAKQQAVDDFKRAFGITVFGGNATVEKSNEAIQPGTPALKFDASLAKVSDTASGSGHFGKVTWIETTQEGAPPLVWKELAEDNENALQHEAHNYELAGEHPNITKCYGVQQIGKKKGLVMEGVKGRTMEDTLTVLSKLQKADSKNLSQYSMNKQLSQEDFVGITQYMAMEILSGLAHLEEAGLVHCDIRPSNIMIDETTGAVKIVDFGNVLQEGTDPRKENFPFHTGSVSPDARLDEKITPKHDVFSMGATIYQTMEHKDFRYGTNKTADETPTSADRKKFGDRNNTAQPMRALTPAADTEYTRFINTMMNPDPKKRPSAKALLAAVHQLERLAPEDMEEALVRMEREMPGTGIRFLAQRLGDASRPQELLKGMLTADSVVRTSNGAQAKDAAQASGTVHANNAVQANSATDQKPSGEKNNEYGYGESAPDEGSESKDTGYDEKYREPLNEDAEQPAVA